MPKTAERGGTVIDVRRWGYGVAAVVDSTDGRYVMKFRADDDLPENLSQGDIVVFSGVFEPFERAEEPREFDEYLYWRARGAVAALTDPIAKIAGSSRGVARWRAVLEKRIRKALPPRTAGYALASLVGKKDASLETLHRSVGTSHLLAVSGAHVAIVYCIFWSLLRGMKARLYILSAAIWFYVAMTGLGPGAVRAAIMIQLVIIGRIIGRAGKTFNTVSLAGVLMLFHNPWIFWDVGWRFSMLAALAITAASALDVPGEVKIFLASVMAWLATSVQAAWTFDSTPVVGIIANFFAIPVFTVLFPFSFAFSLPSMIGMPWGRFASAVPEFLFVRWERLSNNLLMLCPWQLSFSATLLLIGVSALTFFFAVASGFEKRGAVLAAAINTIGLCAILFL
jgi:competence protein ComEC